MVEKRKDSVPRTAGELRRILNELGNPWTVDPRLNDDDPLPNYQRGGEIPLESARVSDVREEDFVSFLKRHLPSNPLLRDHWIKLGLIEEEEDLTTHSNKSSSSINQGSG